MKNLLAFVAAAALVFVGVGWYLDWFHIDHAPSASGHQAFSIDLNAEKMEADVKRGSDRVVDAIEKARLDAAARKAEADRQAAAPVKVEIKRPDVLRGER